MTSSMASSSTTSNEKTQKSFLYDVFLSFRGEDTRTNFVSHLHQTLTNSGIQTYKDDVKIEKGETIDDQLIKSIQRSRFFIIVFSKTYASSSWCLKELVEIMECQKTPEQTAFPIFYVDVEPTHVRTQSEEHDFGKAFAKNRKKEAAGDWIKAMEEASHLAGWELKATENGDESKLIQLVVAKIFEELCSINTSADEKLVGMEMRIKEVLSSIEIGVEDVRMIGIKGIGGGGKTTLARAVFDQISSQFEGKSFVENVREVSKPTFSGLKKLQTQILMDIFSDQDISISNVTGGKTTMRQMLRRKKILVVLDDVNATKQLEALSGASNWFKPGSRIIITTREGQVLEAHSAKFINHFVHEINLLSPDEAICLFSRYAFGTDIPIEGYKDLSGEVVEYADGLPLTIEVLGSFLCGQDEIDWKDALERLKTIPLEETMEILKISYNGLANDYKDIFLDIACLLKGWYKDEAIRALESCGFHARNGLRVLEQKSLIKISKYGVLDMHDHIQEMGRHIVRHLHAGEPDRRRSRLWIDDEIEDILANDLGTEATECIKLRTENLHVKGLAKLKALRFLTVYSVNNELSGSEDDGSDNDQELDEVSQYLPNSLRFLRWSGYPFWSFPKTFQANNLVGLVLHDSNIVQLWEGGEGKALCKLRFLDIFDLKVRTLDLRLTPNLEILSISTCENLVELQMPTERLKLTSINLTLIPNLDKLCLINCPDLVELVMPKESQNLRIFKLNHSKLKTFHLGITPNLEELVFEDCNDLVELHMPAESLKLRSLKLSHLKLRILKLEITPNLVELILEDCNDLVELHMPTQSLKLTSLILSHSKLRILTLGITPNLAKLILEDCNDLVELHNLPKSVNFLKLSNSRLRILDLGITSKLKELILEDCKYLVELHMPHESLHLRSLKISNSNLRILELGFTPDLGELILEDCNDFVELKMPAMCLSLVYLDLSYTAWRNLDLRFTPNLETLSLRDHPDSIDHLPSECPLLISLSHSKLRTLHLGNTRNLVDVSLNACNDLVEFYMPGEYLNLVSLTISDSKLRTLCLGSTPNLKSFTLKSCPELVEFDMPSECLKLISLELSHLKLKTLDLGLTPTLETLSLNCDDLVELCMPTESVNLRYLTLRNLKLKTLDLGNTPNLDMLSLGYCHDLVKLHMPTECLSLRSLELQHVMLTILHFEMTPNLVELTLSSNSSSLPDSICMLKNLKSLTCYHLGKLPEAIGGLECLQELYLSSASIRNLPDSICKLKQLKSLEISSCYNLEKLPEAIGQLECLERLIVSASFDLQDVPNSICEMKLLKYLDINYCTRVEKLPAEIGCLESLEVLDIADTRIKYLPHSIFQLKGLRIIGSKKIFEATGITSEIQTSYNGIRVEECIFLT